MSDFKKWECVICGFVYDEAEGWPDDGIEPGTKWEDVPEDWECPDCGISKFDFDMVEVQEDLGFCPSAQECFAGACKPHPALRRQAQSAAFSVPYLPVLRQSVPPIDAALAIGSGYVEFGGKK